MRVLLLFVLIFLPVFVFAYVSVIAKPSNATVVLSIADSKASQEFFGRLDDFPHTFEFEVNETFPFKAAIFVPDWPVQKNDVSIILVKEERRGVSEIGRTSIKAVPWESQYDSMIVESFRSGGSLETSIEPGRYKLEVSSPNNEGKYRLVLGTEKIDRNYFIDLRVLFEVTEFLENSKLGTIRSPLLYWPLLIVLIGAVCIFIYKKRKAP